MPPDLRNGIRVRDVMAAPVTTTPDAPLGDVIGRMTAQRVGAILVVAGERLVGIFTERDFLHVASQAPHGWRQRSVADWMTCEPQTIAPDADWEQAVSLMEQRHVRHLPVVTNGRPVGIVAARQLMAHRTEHLNRLVLERTDELERLTGMLQEREREAQRDLRVAGRLLSRLLLPGPPPDWPEYVWAVHFRPLGTVGGDYYDFARPDGRHLGVLVADASGHNVAAALVAVMARVAFDEAIQIALRPADVLGAMNEHLQGIADERYVTAMYGVFDRIDRTFTFANAGHPVALHYDARSHACNPLEATGFMLGIMPDAVYDEWTVTLGTGDAIVLYSDGVTECRNESEEAFGVERLARIVLDTAARGAGHVMREALMQLAAHRGNRATADDETLLVAEVRG